MLVRGGVKHDVRPQVAENVIQPIHIPNGGNDDLQVQLFAIFADQLLLHVVGVVFVNIQNGQLFRVQGCDLPAQLRADRAAAAGDQHSLPLVKRSGLGILHLDGVAEQQILDAEVPQLALLGGRVVLRSGGVVVNLHGAAGIAIALIQLLLALHRQIRQGNNDLPHFHLFQKIHGAVALGIDGHAVHRLADLLGVGVYEAHRHIPRPRIAEKLVCQRSAHIAGAHNGYLHLIQLVQGVPLQRIVGVLVAVRIEELVAVAGQQRHQQNSHSHDHVHADAQIHRKAEAPDQHQNKIGNKIRNHDGQVGLDVGIAPDVTIHAESDTPRHDRPHQRQQAGQVNLAVEHDRAELQELHQVGHIVYANDDGYIHQHQLYFSST